MKIATSIALSLAAVLCGCLPSDDKKIAELERRVSQLEQAQAASAAKASEPNPLERRVALLESQSKQQPQAQQKPQFSPEEQVALNKYQSLARARMNADYKIYLNDDLEKVEKLYQTVAKEWNSDACRESLKKLLAEYPKANRTGCTILYLAQMMGEGDERTALLQKAIEDYGDCYYGNGVNVGIYAKYHLVFHYARIGEREKAISLAEEIKSQFPDALDHGGRLLVPIIDATLPKALKE